MNSNRMLFWLNVACSIVNFYFFFFSLFDTMSLFSLGVAFFNGFMAYKLRAYA